MKRFLALLLTAALVLGLAVPVLAENGENGYNGYYEENGYYNNGYYNDNGYNGYNDENGYYNDYNGEDDYLSGYAPRVWEMFERPFPGNPANSRYGFIGEVTQADCGNYTVEILDEDGEVQLIVWLLAGNYAVIDAATGLPAGLEDHNDGEVLVIYGPLYTFHDIPQVNALVIAVNVEGVEYSNFPHHHVIEAIEWDEYGEAIKLTVDNGGLIVTLNEDTDLKAWLTRQVVVLDEFQVGDEVLLWYSFVGLSYPAQTTASRALRLVPAAEAREPYEEPPYEPAYEDDEPYNEDDAFVLTGESIVRAGVYLWPVRVNAVAAGFEVYWNAGLWRAELTTGDIKIILTPGSAIFYINGEAYPMTAPTLLEGGTLFAPVEFFSNLHQ